MIVESTTCHDISRRQRGIGHSRRSEALCLASDATEWLLVMAFAVECIAGELSRPEACVTLEMVARRIHLLESRFAVECSIVVVHATTRHYHTRLCRWYNNTSFV
jgi:hypothetical protein